MTDSHRQAEDRRTENKTETQRRPASPPADSTREKPLSMHDGIAVWCDCCSCEAEPYWVEIAEEMGVDLGSDYEDTKK